MKKIIAFLIAASMLAFLAVSCGTEEPASSSAAVSEGQSSEASAEAEVSKTLEEQYGIITDGRYAGRTFTVYSSDVDEEALSDIVPNSGPVNGDTMPDTVNKALMNRQNLLRDTLGVELKEIYFYDSARLGGQALSHIRTAVDSSSDEFQAINISLYDCGTLSLEGYLYNLNDVKGFDPENPWWDQSFNSSVEMAGKLFFTAGDIELRNKNSTTCVIFNRTLCKKLGLDDPYELALNCKWTLDKCIEMGMSYKDDIDGDGTIEWNDGFSWAGQYDDMYAMMYGSGIRIVSADANGYPSLSFYSSKTDEVVTKILTFMTQSDYYVSGNDLWDKTPYKWPMEALLETFNAGKCLFFGGLIESIAKVKDMTDEFGILPSPMYNEEQHEYYSLLNTWGANSVAIALNVGSAELEYVATVLDTMGFYSWKEYPDSLSHNYYEVVIKNQKLTAEEGEKMLDLIFGSRGCELGAIYQVGKSGSSGSTVYDLLSEKLMASKQTSGLRSLYEANEDKLRSSIQDIIDTFKSLD